MLGTTYSTQVSCFFFFLSFLDFFFFALFFALFFPLFVDALAVAFVGVDTVPLRLTARSRLAARCAATAGHHTTQHGVVRYTVHKRHNPRVCRTLCCIFVAQLFQLILEVTRQLCQPPRHTAHARQPTLAPCQTMTQSDNAPNTHWFRVLRARTCSSGWVSAGRAGPSARTPNPSRSCLRR